VQDENHILYVWSVCFLETVYLLLRSST